MNGEPLTRDHGAPFRLIVPGWYGVASVKWLKRITVLTEQFAGDFQTSRYVYEWPDRPHEPVTHTRVRARITEPAHGGAITAGTYTVRGKAWSGTGPVTRVEVSLSGAGEWHDAQSGAPAWTIRVAGLVIRVGGDDARTPHDPRPRHGRRRERAARGPALEPARIRQQRRRGLHGRRALKGPSATIGLETWTDVKCLHDVLHGDIDGLGGRRRDGDPEQPAFPVDHRRPAVA